MLLRHVSLATGPPNNRVNLAASTVRSWFSRGRLRPPQVRGAFGGYDRGDASMNRPTKLGAMWGAIIAGVVAIPVLFPMFFFISADNQTFAGGVAAFLQCMMYEACLAFVGALAGALIGGVIYLFTKGTGG